jgi:predicted nucleotide-binding protein (sugar kinase/HSP70/actin superfamily)
MVDLLDNLRRKIRPYELVAGETDRVADAASDSVISAFEHGGMIAGYLFYKKAVNALCAVPYDRSVRKNLVFITGEYLQVFHPGANYHIERYLEKNNMEVELPRMYDIYRNLMLFHTVSEIRDFKVRHPAGDMLYAFGGEAYVDFALDTMEKVALRHPLYERAPRIKEMTGLSDPIIHHSIQSGEGFLIAADILHHAEEGVRSFIILQPFGCLPNHVCGRGLIKPVKEQYPGIQVLPLDYDPDTSYANIENRLQMLILNARDSGGLSAAAGDENGAKPEEPEAAGKALGRETV